MYIVSCLYRLHMAYNDVQRDRRKTYLDGQHMCNVEIVLLCIHHVQEVQNSILQPKRVVLCIHHVQVVQYSILQPKRVKKRILQKKALWVIILVIWALVTNFDA
jgi:hypothetical protein